jgi:uncharacterized protein (TIGR03086 family)
MMRHDAMTDNKRLFVTAVFGFDAVVRRAPPDAWDRPSPCERWRAREVVGHCVAAAAMVEAMAQGRPPVVPATPGDERPAAPGVAGHVWSDEMLSRSRRRPVGSGDDPVPIWVAQRDAVLDALEAPGVLERETISPWGETTIDAFLGFVWYDAFVHTWDLAVSVGVDAALDPAMAERALAMLDDLERSGRPLRQPISWSSARDALGADAVSRLIAFTGRDPRWAPPG